jgi:uncharacterized repeat protein (TIGR01451 family)
MKKHFFYLNLLKIQAMKRMKIWLVMVALVCAVGAQGQGWMKTYGDALGDTRIGGFAETNDGMLIMSASSSSHDTTIILKVDENGEIVIVNQLLSAYGGFKSRDIRALNDGAFLVIGSSRKQYSFYSTLVPTIIKVDSLANKIWEAQIPVAIDTISNYLPYDATFASNGNIILSGLYIGTFDDGIFLAELNSQGELIWKKNFSNLPSFGVSITYTGVEVVEDKNIVLLSSGAPDIKLIKTDSIGNLLWEKIFGYTSTWLGISTFLKDNDGNLLLAGRKEYVLPEPTVPYVVKLNSFGEKIWEYEFGNLPIAQFTGAATALDGGYYLYGFQEINVNRNLFLTKVNTDGIVAWNKFYDINSYDYSDDIFQISDGSIRVTGRIGSNQESFIAKITSNGILFSSALTGTLHQDPESDCLPDPTEPGLSGWLVQAEGNQSFATLTDSFGHFTLPVDTGSYTVTIAPPGPYWEICNSPTTATITAFYDTLTFDFPAQAIAECPYLTVDISAPFLRRCFDNNYYVHYCNDGTVTANDATVEVTLDPYFTYISSTLPLASQNGNTLTFDLGDVAVNDCGSFQITAYLDCDSTVLGQTHCTLAHITPDSLCLEPDPLWDGSSIEVDVSCNGDSVTFTITNAGTGGMPAPLGFIIIEDQIVLMTGDFQLGPGQSTMVTVPANGTTLHLEAQQAAAHPSGYASTGATIEGCGGWMSLGFFTQWSFDDDPEPFTDVDCQANTGSFDPNDKQGFPTGLGDEHLIEPGQDIEYLIRFQNTGTDTAFKVTVVDVLPPELDLATVRPGASSHPYTYGVIPEGWLTFTFDNIQLPDSTTNEAASHGFIRFRASQRPGLGWGNVIANTALIYFDFNAPVQTNTYLHKVGQVFLWTVVGVPPVLTPSAWLRIMPNPMTDSAILQVEGIAPGEVTMTLTDAMGRVLRVVKGPSEGFEFRRDGLAGGLYFFKLEKDGRWLTGGKLMVK